MTKPNEEDASIPETPTDLESAIRKRILASDRRYAMGAYLFIYEALAFTQKELGRDDPEMAQERRHVSGQELLEGIRHYAEHIFGPLAPSVFRNWGVRKTEDFGEIVFSLVENNLLGKTESDSRRDFAGGFDLDSAFDGPIKVKPE